MSVTEMNSSENDCLELAAKEMRSIAVEPVPQHVIQRTLLATGNDPRPANQESSSRWWTIAASVALIAAVIVVAVSFLHPGSSTVLADVVANAIQARSVSFVQQIELNGRTRAEARVQVQGDALRCEFTNGVVWVEDSSRRQGVFLDVNAKEAAKRELHEPSSNQSRWQTDPMQWLRRLKPTEARWLGERTVDGRPADLFSGKVSGVFTEGTGSYGFAPDHAIRIWVDRETDLPLRIEIRSPGGSDSIAFSKIQWNERIAEARFSLEVPDGFDVVPLEEFLERLPQTTAQN